MIDHCQGCGQCCMHMRTPPHCVPVKDGAFVHPSEVFANETRDDDDFDFALLMAAPQEARDLAMQKMFDDDAPENDPCAWFDEETKRCRFYRFRPLVCRDFAVGSEPCRDHRARVGLTIDGLPVVGLAKEQTND